MRGTDCAACSSHVLMQRPVMQLMSLQSEARMATSKKQFITCCPDGQPDDFSCQCGMMLVM